MPAQTIINVNFKTKKDIIHEFIVNSILLIYQLIKR